MIHVENVSKYFGNFAALKDISFHIKQGEIVGFLGPNGAGKTTLMRLLTSFLPATGGKIVIDGLDLEKHFIEARREIGYLPENPPLYSNMVVRDYLKFAAHLKDVPYKRMKVHIDRVLRECDIKDVQKKVIGTLSRGYKQRVGIAQAIIHEPKIIILDEPTNGLDPLQILKIRHLIKSFEHKRTVILSTHILSEIEQIARRVFIVQSGEIIVDEQMSSLLFKNQPELKLYVRVRGHKPRIEQIINEEGALQLIEIQSDDNEHLLSLKVTKDVKHYNEFIQRILGVNGHILEIHQAKSTLEDVFLKVTKKDE